MRLRGGAAVLGICGILLAAPAAGAQPTCGRAVVVTTPGVTWAHISELPPGFSEAVEKGAVGSVSVRTNRARTSYASGFTTLGAGTRVEGGVTTGGPLGPEVDEGLFDENVAVAGLGEILDRVAVDGYDAVPGALAGALPDVPVIAIGNADAGKPPSGPHGLGRWTLLAAMDPSGRVDLAATGPGLVTGLAATPGTIRARTDMGALRGAVEDALRIPCAVTVVDQGDLIRAEEAPDANLAQVEAALAATGEVLGWVQDGMDFDKDLLVVVSPTSPARADDVHLGIAIARGPGFAEGSELSSASTGRRAMVTLPDVAPTVLAHLGVERPPSMLGRPWFALASRHDDRAAAALTADREAVFIDRVRTPVSTAFVVLQAAIYAAIALLLWWGERASERARPRAGGYLELAAMAVVAFPATTYIAGVVDQHELGGWGLAALLAVLDGLLLLVVCTLFRRSLDRLLVLTAGTTALLVTDLVLGAPLQVNTVFSYSPIVAGRFSGIGNTAFAVLAATTVVTGTLIVHHWGRSPRTLSAVAVLFAAVVVVDGAPAFGSDVGGVLALVPGLALTLLLLAGRRPSIKVVVACVIATGIAVALFLALDLARPPADRTHLARLYEDVQARGMGALTDTLSRKASTNLRVFTSTIWTYLVPPALGLLAWLLLRPRRRWEWLADEYPILRAGLIGGLLVALLGFAVNDSGIVVPAMMLSFLVPTALVVHLVLERRAAP